LTRPHGSKAGHRVCDILQLTCDREDPLTEIVVTKIAELAKAGERDPEKLCFDVLAQLETPAQDISPPASRVGSSGSLSPGLERKA
jgi:hypothetical protein